MTQEEKELLLKDLCARLQYGVFIRVFSGDYKLLGIDENIVHLDTPVYDEGDGYFDIDYLDIKPYLRPMSSMTREEQEEFIKFHCVNICPIILTDMLTLDNESKMFDWLNKKWFDYRGLIPMGLALPATEEMYKIN